MNYLELSISIRPRLISDTVRVRQFEHLDIAAEPTNKAAVLGFPQIFWAIDKEYRSGLPSLLMLAETFKIFHVALTFKPYCPYYEVVNLKTTQFVDAGLTDYWLKETINPKLQKKVVEKIEPQVLTLDHLDVGFLACLIPLLASMIVFVVELFVKWLENLYIYKYII